MLFRLDRLDLVRAGLHHHDRQHHQRVDLDSGQKSRREVGRGREDHVPKNNPGNRHQEVKGARFLFLRFAAAL